MSNGAVLLCVTRVAGAGREESREHSALSRNVKEICPALSSRREITWSII